MTDDWVVERVKDVSQKYGSFMPGKQMADLFSCSEATISEAKNCGTGPLRNLIRFVNSATVQGMEPAYKRDCDSAHRALADLICTATGHIAIRPPQPEHNGDCNVRQALSQLLHEFAGLVRGVNGATQPDSEGGEYITQREYQEIRHLAYNAVRATLTLVEMSKADMEEMVAQLRIERMEQEMLGRKL